MFCLSDNSIYGSSQTASIVNSSSSSLLYEAINSLSLTDKCALSLTVNKFKKDDSINNVHLASPVASALRDNFVDVSVDNSCDDFEADMQSVFSHSSDKESLGVVMSLMNTYELAGN